MVLNSRAIAFLKIRNEGEYQIFVSRSSPDRVYNQAYDYLEEAPLEDLPPYIGHPSLIVKDIVNKRLSGRTDYIYGEIREVTKGVVNGTTQPREFKILRK